MSPDPTDRPGDELHERLLIEEVASILVDERHNIVHLTKPAGRYLECKEGTPSHNIVDAVPDALRVELRSGLRQAFKKNEEAEHEWMRAVIRGEPRHVTMRIRLVADGDRFAQIILTDTEPLQTADRIDEEGGAAPTQHAARLQSVNEELKTTNRELKSKIEELRLSNSDLRNLMESTDIATLFLDRQLQIERFTPRVRELFNIRSIDSGRPLSDFSQRFASDHLVADAQSVLDSLQPVQTELHTEAGTWFLVRLRPYRTVSDQIDGVVITFVEITDLKKAQREVEHEREYAVDIVDTMWEPFLVLDEGLRVQSANDSFYETFEVTPEETTDQLVYELGNGQWDIPELRQLLEEILPDQQVITDYDVDHTFETIGRCIMRLNARRIDHKQLILLAIEDITKRKQSERELREREERFRALVTASSYVIYRMSPDWSVMRELDGRGFIADTKSPTEAWMNKYIHPDDQPKVQAAIDEAVRTKSMFDLEHQVRRPDGTLGWTHSRAVPILDEEGEIVEWFGAASDITERKKVAEQLHAESEFVDRVLETIGSLIIVVDPEGRIAQFNRECEAVSGYAADEAQGENILELLIPQEDREAIRQVLAEHAQGLEQSVHENHWVTKDGDRRLIRWTSTVLRDDEGRFQNVIGTGTDITERRQLEREVLNVSDEERRRIGQDLHDMLASQLAGIAMMIRALIGKMERGESLTTEDLQKVGKLVNESGGQARALSHSLMPLEVQGDALADGLQHLVRRQETMTPRTACSFEWDGSIPPLESEVASHLYRIASEAVSNAIKHADPDTITVRLTADDDRLTLAVCDDGTGMPDDTEPTDGLGLHMIKYRSELIGARLTIGPAEGGGTRVQCTLPLQRATKPSGDESD